DQITVSSSTIPSQAAANRESPRSPAHRHIALWLFAAFQFFYLLTSTGRTRTPDEYNTLYTTESLTLHASTAVPQAVQLHNFYGRYDLHGQPRAAYPPGQALLCVPWYALGQYLLARLPGVPPDDTDLVVAFSSCLSNATFAALTVTFFFLLLTGIGIALRPALFAAALVGLATPIFAYSAWLFSEPISPANLNHHPNNHRFNRGPGVGLRDPRKADRWSGHPRLCRSCIHPRWKVRAAHRICLMPGVLSRSRRSPDSQRPIVRRPVPVRISHRRRRRQAPQHLRHTAPERPLRISPVSRQVHIHLRAAPHPRPRRTSPSLANRARHRFPGSIASPGLSLLLCPLHPMGRWILRRAKVPRPFDRIPLPRPRPAARRTQRPN